MGLAPRLGLNQVCLLFHHESIVRDLGADPSSAASKTAFQAAGVPIVTCGRPPQELKSESYERDWAMGAILGEERAPVLVC